MTLYKFKLLKTGKYVKKEKDHLGQQCVLIEGFI